MPREEIAYLNDGSKIQTRIIKDKYGYNLGICTNGFQWSEQPLTPELASKTILALRLYLVEVGENER